MTDGMAETAAVTLPLDSRRAGRVLAQAARRKAKIELTPTGGQVTHSVVARVIETGSNSLLALTDSDVPRHWLPSSYCDAQLELNGVLYLFAACVLEIAHRDDQCCIRLDRPESVHMLQRRRFPRRRLARSTTVSIRSHAQPAASASASLLNLSTDGMACLTGRSDAEILSVDDIITVRFQLSDEAKPLELESQVRGKTPGGDDHDVILNIRFSELEPNDPRAVRLRRALTLDTH